MLKKSPKLHIDTKLITYMQWAVFIVTVIAIFLYPFLPDKKLTIVPSDETWANLHSVNSENDRGINIKWVGEQQNHWLCTVKESISSSICGAYFTWRDESFVLGRDLSGFEYIKLNVDYKGNAKRIRLFLRNFDDNYSTVQDYNSRQYLFTELRQSDLSNGELKIALTEITVADWWLDGYQHPRKYALPQFNNITTFSLEIFGDDIVGIHEMGLNSIEFTGPLIKEKNYYFGIILIFLLVAFIHLIIRLYVAKTRTKTAVEKGEELARNNKVLSQEKDRYRDLSVLDALTQVPNRHGFEEFILNTITSTSKNVSLIMLDIDNFKKTNDTYGHDFGDLALTKLATLLLKNTRSNDYFARWGGEEFIVCCLDTSMADTYKFAEKLRILIEKSIFGDEHQLKITISLGIATRNPKESLKEWFNRADQALYQAKNSGRNKTVSL
ncbi:MAG: GGDEF domain-containing protein [Colwellia sp.]